MTLQSARQRQKDTNYLIQRDGGICLYCNQKLDFQDYKNPVEIDHLDNNPHNNAEYNKILTHSKCNKEKQHSADYQVIAANKMKENQRRIIDIKVEDTAEDSVNYEIRHNKATMQLTEQKLLEIISQDGRANYREALKGIAYHVAKIIGHCSEKSIRQSIDQLTNSFPTCEGPFMIISEDSQKWIVKRTGI